MVLTVRRWNPRSYADHADVVALTGTPVDVRVAQYDGAAFSLRGIVDHREVTADEDIDCVVGAAEVAVVWGRPLGGAFVPLAVANRTGKRGGAHGEGHAGDNDDSD